MAKLQTLTDTFDTYNYNNQWTAGFSNGAVTTTGGRLQLTVSSGGGFVYYQSIAGYDVPDSYITFQLFPGAQSLSMQLNATSGNSVVSVQINNGSTYSVQAQNSGGSATIPTTTGTWNSVSMAWWRVRQVSVPSNTIYIETSPDGSTWTTLTSGVGFTAAYPYRVQFQQIGQGTAYVDNVNVAPPLPAIATLTDQFTGTTLDTTKWFGNTSGGGSVAVANGQVALSNTATNGSYGQITTDPSGAYTYSIIGSAVYARITPSTATNVQLVMEVQSSAGYYVGLRVINGQVLYQAGNTGVYAALPGATYSASTWQYWRIRVAANGTLAFDYSSDGATWLGGYQPGYTVTQANFPAVRLQIYSQLSGTGVASTSYIDSVNLVGTAAYAGTSSPNSITDPETLTPPTPVFNITTAPGNVTDPDTVTAPGSDYLPYPGGIIDGEIVGTPSAAWSASTTPGSVTDPDIITAPGNSYWPMPDGVNDNTSIGTPSVVFMPDKLYPGNITDVGPLGTPSVEFRSFYTGGYGQGPYGVGLYNGMYIELDPITDPETFAEPVVDTRPSVAPAGIIDGDIVNGPALTGAAIGTAIVPAGVSDPETLAGPTLTFVGSDLYGQGLYGQGLYGVGAVGQVEVVTPPEYGGDNGNGQTNYIYGAGTYGLGIYYGMVAAVSDANPTDNPTYGIGTYGYGIYYGEQITTPDAVPLFTIGPATTRPPMHLLGIGPWSAAIYWRGAENYGVPSGNTPARPTVALPPATSKTFTLRLDGGSEATAELSLPRGAAVVIDEMDTDLWWRRKDPRTRQLEMIGRFNTSHVSLSTSDTGVSVSLQFDDYRTILGERMVLKYLHPKATPYPESIWNGNRENKLPINKITDVLKFALPNNTGIDISEAVGPTPYDLGELTQSYDLPPDTTIEQLMENLNAISPIRWEWWVETPLDINLPPKLRFQLGTRGTDKGVVLHDLGKGPSPIASWTRTAAASDYVNTLLYQGTDGGVLEQIPAQVAQYGERDGTASNSTLGGKQIDMLRAAAKRKLEKLADRRPTFSINLAAGFWRGRSHIDVGDTVTLLIRLGKERIYDKYRVTELTVSIDDVGMESVSVTLGTPLVSADGRSKQAPLTRILRYLKNYSAPPGSLAVPSDTE